MEKWKLRTLSISTSPILVDKQIKGWVRLEVAIFKKIFNEIF